MDFPIYTQLRSAAMRTTALSVGAVVLLATAVSASAATGSAPAVKAAAAASPLSNAIKALGPYVYWPLNTGATPETDASGHGRPGLTTAGSGPTVLLSSGSHPPGGSGGSVAFRPAGQQTGQFLRSTQRPIPGGTKGTLVVWFKVGRTLPPWWQTLVVDNGATTGFGAGFFITNTGRLALADASATFDPLGNFGPRKRTVSGPLNDGRWHMAAFVDQYNVDSGPLPRVNWKPSLIYLDGALVDRTVEGRLMGILGGSPGSRLDVGAGQRTQASTLGEFEGNVSNVALFAKLLSAKQIAGIWQAGS